jgi:hypothetical protein
VVANTSLALVYPVGNSTESLRAAVVRLIDVLRALQTDADQQAAIDVIEASVGDISLLQSELTASISALTSATTAADAALNASVTAVLGTVGVLETDVAVLQSNELTPQERFEIALDHAIDTVQGSRLEFEQQMQLQMQRIVDFALQVRRLTNDNSAQIVTEQVTRVTETEAFASQLTALTADLASTSAAVVTETTARAAGDSALASNITMLTATVAGNTTSITEFATVQSGILTDVSALENGVTGLTTDLGQVEAQWGVAINTQGQVIGLIQLDGGASGSQFSVVADKFVVAHPTAPGTLITPIVVGLVNGVSTIGLNGAVVVDGTIVARHIAAAQIDASKLNVASLSAISANIGTVTAGLIRNVADTIRFDLPAMRIYRTDGSMNVDFANKVFEIA